MLKFLNTQKQLIKERRKNEQLQAALLKNEADTEYIAMMCDVELDIDKDNTMTEVENYESEV